MLSFDHRAATAELDLEHGFGDGITALGGELAPAAFSQTVWHSTQLVQYKFGVTSLLLNEKKFVVPTSSWRGILCSLVWAHVYVFCADFFSVCMFEMIILTTHPIILTVRMVA